MKGWHVLMLAGALALAAFLHTGIWSAYPIGCKEGRWCQIAVVNRFTGFTCLAGPGSGKMGAWLRCAQQRRGR